MVVMRRAYALVVGLRDQVWRTGVPCGARVPVLWWPCSWTVRGEPVVMVAVPWSSAVAAAR